MLCISKRSIAIDSSGHFFRTQVFYDRNAVALIRAMAAGGATPEFERIASEGAGLCGGVSQSTLAAQRRRARMTQHSVRSSQFSSYSVR